MRVDYRNSEALEHSLAEGAQAQLLAELASILAYHKSRQILEVKRSSLAEAEAELKQAEKKQAKLDKQFEVKGEKLFDARHFEERHRPPLFNGGIPAVRPKYTRDQLNERIAVAERELRDANAVKRDNAQRVLGLQEEIKQINHEIQLLEQLSPPAAAPGLSVVLNFIGA